MDCKRLCGAIGLAHSAVNQKAGGSRANFFCDGIKNKVRLKNKKQYG